MSYELGLRTRVAWAIFAFFILASTIVSRTLGAPAAGSSFVYVAGSTDRPSRGIYAYRFDSKTGELTAIGRVADVVSPGFLATDPHHRFLYVASDMDQDPKKTGFLSSYSINAKTGALTLLNKADLDGGPCHLVVDDTGRILFATNYGNGTVASFALKQDGSIGQKTGFDQHTGKGPNAERQEGPHAHAVVLSPDNRFLFVPDLGSDQIKIYKVDAAKRTFTPNDPSFASVNPGLGPRHFVFGRGAKFAYVVCEMGSSVVVFAYDPVKGSLTPVQTISTLPAGFKGIDNSAEIDIGRTGRFLYASNRGHDSITVFAIDPNKGTLTKVQVAPSLGKIPRNFALDPTGNYLLAGNQESDQLVVFTVDQTNGKLTPAGQVLDVPAPDCILFVPAA